MIKPGSWVAINPSKVAMWKECGVALSIFTPESFCAKVPKDVDLEKMEKAVEMGMLVITAKKPKVPKVSIRIPLVSHLKKTVKEIKKLVADGEFDLDDLEHLLNLELRSGEPRKGLTDFLSVQIAKTATKHEVGKLVTKGKGKKKRTKVVIAKEFNRKSKIVDGVENMAPGEPELELLDASRESRFLGKIKVEEE